VGAANSQNVAHHSPPTCRNFGILLSAPE
jgi:hypothetical protein